MCRLVTNPPPAGTDFKAYWPQFVSRQSTGLEVGGLRVKLRLHQVLEDDKIPEYTISIIHHISDTISIHHTRTTFEPDMNTSNIRKEYDKHITSPVILFHTIVVGQLLIPMTTPAYERFRPFLMGSTLAFAP